MRNTPLFMLDANPTNSVIIDEPYYFLTYNRRFLTLTLQTLKFLSK